MDTQLEVQRNVEYAVHGGESLKGQLYLPSGPGPQPQARSAVITSASPNTFMLIPP